jgi:putative ATP-binding cassette transporter
MDAKKVDARLSLTYASINLISQYGIYVLLGVVLFLLSFANLFGQNGIATYVVTLLFISGPINNLISMQGFYTKALVANKRVKTFFYDFKPEESAGGNGRGRQGFSSLKLDGVSFKYEGPGPNHAFALDNIHFSLHRGEVVFIVGGNGSGKSTFINMLTGLYKPSSGHILVNNEVVDTSGPDYKDLFSVVFTDNHLFSRNYDNYSLESNPAYAELLKIMQLDQVVSDDSEDSARRRFSKGQGKRMSLIFSLLEDHPILILDEWAADQDPHFRKYFYQKLLPELKKKGLSVIAVTHDETYFSAADRIVKFDYGRIVKDNQPALSTI